ncbi:5-formyltetrahydrofolate cyclo-ligase, mitochondrial-like [Herrania umbratica]|uniref:5-formyltetrahydrofolate cyclo-ligase, mitochondrial-like n=1 Tax=Herrania umbratica TaxID=108875 RepID=A0A6J1B622_9ROSI|nr:5-formyltetrahydrofolate cyclo-ligase, mitochondrial-like [Herrania umbratica]
MKVSPFPTPSLPQNQYEKRGKFTPPTSTLICSGDADRGVPTWLASEKSGSRLGSSEGYYDLFLKNYQELTKKRRWKQPLLIGLSYSVQIMEEGAMPVTPFDIPVDALVSPAGFTPTSTAALRRCD